MLKYLMFLFFISFSALANPVVLITNGTVTGTNGQQTKIISDFMEKENIKTEVKITNSNCALAKLIWDSSQTKTFMLLADGIDGLTDKENNSCYINIQKIDVFFWLYSSPYFFCSANNKTWNDLIKPNSTFFVAVHADNKSEKFFQFLSEKYNNKLKTIKLPSLAPVITMAKAGEIDFAFRSGIVDIDPFKGKCEWASIASSGLPNFQQVSGIKLNNSFVANGYFIGKNINNDEYDFFVEVFNKAASSNEMMKINQRRQYDFSLVSFKTKNEYKNKIDELYQQLVD